jgi:hypothetical protein
MEAIRKRWIIWDKGTDRACQETRDDQDTLTSNRPQQFFESSGERKDGEVEWDIFTMEAKAENVSCRGKKEKSGLEAAALCSEYLMPNLVLLIWICLAILVLIM